MERQQDVIERIRRDHVQRYLFAAERIQKLPRVLDIACGCGYGSWLLHGAGNGVTGVDICKEAINYANGKYAGPAYLRQRAEETKGEWDAICSFETLEHLADPACVLASNRAPLLIASVPNEQHYPFKAHKFVGEEYPHLRHYTAESFTALLGGAGYVVKEWFCQKDNHGDIQPGTDGRYMIAVCDGTFLPND